MADEKQFDIKIEPVKTADSVKPVPVEIKAAQTTTGAASQKPQEDVFLTNIFEKKTENDAVQKNDSKLMEGLIKMEEKSVEKQKSILGKAPEIDTNLFIDIEYHLKRKLSLLKGVFGALILVFLLLGAASYATLDAGYNYIVEQNIGKKFEDKRVELTNKQNELNKLHSQIVKRDLDIFLYNGLQFRQKYNEISSSKSQISDVELKDAKNEVAKSFDNLAEDYAYKNYQEALLDGEMTRLDAEQKFNMALLQKLTSDSNFTEGMEPQEIKEIIKIITPVNHEKLVNIFRDKKSANELQNDRNYLEKIDAVSAVYSSDLTTFNGIKTSRIQWSKYLDEINRITKTVDPDYSGALFSSTFATGRGIKYLSFNIDNDNVIKISGMAITPFSGDTFSMLAYLIDEFNKMPDKKTHGAFVEADMRTFYKNGSGASESSSKYTSNFVITAKLNLNWTPNNQ